ncbi:hypothetical protein IIC65_06225, partial [Candidatus Sumerlaeota bacterium]|nr:hypothetical protein [Candidatus Sumerlaeota bacterium]
MNQSHAGTFEFWLGRAGSGKTHACIHAIAGELRSRPRGLPLLFLVPEQATAQIEYDLATRPGLSGFTRARVISFRLLQDEAFRRLGGRPADVVDEPARIMLLRKVIRRLSGELLALRQSWDLPGSSATVGRTLREFTRYGWKPKDLRHRIEALEAEGKADTILHWKLQDLEKIWRAYDALLEEKGLVDASRLSEAACDQVRRWDEIDGARLWIDGFASFTGEELGLLEALLSRCDYAAMALCLDPARVAGFSGGLPAGGLAAGGIAADRLALGVDDAPATRRIGPERVFENIEFTYASLRSRLVTLGWTVKDISLPKENQPTRFDSPALAHLEARVLTRLRPQPYRPGRHPTDSPGDSPENYDNGRDAIELIEAENFRAEVEAVARRISALCSGSSGPLPSQTPAQESPDGAALRDLRWSDITVIARDLSPYSPLIREIFPRYGIPFFLDDPRTLCGHSLSRLLLSALSIIQHDWRGDDVLDYLACGLSPLRDADAAARLQNLAHRRRLAGKDWMDLAKWTGESPGSRRREQTESDFKAWMEAAGPVRELEAALLGKGAGGGPHSSPSGAAGAIWNFLQRLDVASRLEDWCERARLQGNHELALIHAQAWKEVVAILDRLHLIGRASDEAMEMDLDELREDVETALSTVRAELIPPTLDQVLIGSVERSRTPKVKVAFVMGLIDGEFPRAHEEDPMLGDRERETLTSAGRTLGPDSERRFTHERFLTYVALTRPSRKLVLSRPLIDSAGKSAGPSSFFRAVTEAFPELPISGARQADP